MNPPPRRRIAGLAVRAGAVLAAVFVVALLSHPWWLGAALGGHLSRTAGREVHFDSARVGLTMSLAPVLVMRGVRIANAPWDDPAKPFVSLGLVSFQFGWLRFDDRWVIEHMVLRDGEVRLVRRADGSRNWRLLNPEDRGPGHFWFRALEPHSASLEFVNEGLELTLRTRASDLAPDRPPSATGDAVAKRVDFDGSLRGVAFKGSAESGPVITFLQTERWFALRGHAEVDGARLELDGRAADLFRATQIDAEARLRGRSLAALEPFVGARYSAPKDLQLAGRLRVDAGRYSLAAARAKVGATDLAGDLSWASQGERRTVGVTLASDSTDLADLLWLAGRAAPATGRATRAAQAAAAKAPSGDPFAGARRVDVDLDFAAKRFRAAAAPMVQSLRVKARLADGMLAVSALDLGWGGGHSTGTLAFDLREPLAAAEAQIETRGVRVETLFPAQEADRRVTGMLRGRVALRSRGADLDALRAAANGSIAVGLSDGTIPSLLDAQMGLQGGKLMRTLLSGSEALALPCAAATAQVSAGRASIRSLVIDSANTRTTGTGSIDLRDASIDVVLTPQPKRPGIFELQKSIRLSGRLPRPEKALVDRVAPLKVAECTAAAKP